MDQYLLFNSLLQCKVLDKQQLHPNIWDGANKKFKVIPKLVKIRQYNEKMEKAAQDEKKMAKKQRKLKQKLAHLQQILDLDIEDTVERNDTIAADDKKGEKHSDTVTTPKRTKREKPIEQVGSPLSQSTVDSDVTPKASTRNFVSKRASPSPIPVKEAKSTPIRKKPALTKPTPTPTPTSTKKATPKKKTHSVEVDEPETLTTPSKRARTIPLKYSPKSPLHSTPKKTPKRK